MNTRNCCCVCVVLLTLCFVPTTPTEAQIFDPSVEYGAGDSPSSVAIGDLNGDGNPDLAVANFHDDTVSVLLGTGDGTFPTAQNFNVDNGPQSVATDDFDGDGNLDLATANSGSLFASVLLGNGDGTFQGAVGYIVGPECHSVVIGDLNGDNHPDLVFSERIKGSVVVLLGNGDGTFQPFEYFGTGDEPYSVAIGDLNGDGDLDLATANAAAVRFSRHMNTVSVLLGNGDGTFQDPVHIEVDDRPYFVTIGDLNDDDNQDLAVVKLVSENVSVLLGNGDGTFQPAEDYWAGTSPWSVAIGDLDGDDRPDLAVTTRGSDAVSVLPGNGDGTFESAESYGAGAGPVSVAIGDLDGDSRLDLAVANNSSDDLSVLINAGATVSAELVCVPSSGTVAFSTQIAVTVTNECMDQSRTIAGHIDVTMANGGFVPDWRVGSVEVPGGEDYFWYWNQSIPASGNMIGDNLFQLIVEDVTPAPYNQPPYPLAGDTGTASCTVTGIAP